MLEKVIKNGQSREKATLWTQYIARFDCAWMQTQKSPNDPHIRIRKCGCKFHYYQPIPHFKILLDIHVHWNLRPLTIWPFVGSHFENGGHSLAILLVRIFHQPYLIYNRYGSFLYKWGQRFWHMFTVSMATAAILNIPRPDGTSWDGDQPSCEV